MHPVINSIGLVLDFVGVVILFLWGPPLPDMEGSVGIGLESGTLLREDWTVADEEKKQQKIRKRHSVVSKVALGIVALGFLFQLIAQWV